MAEIATSSWRQFRAGLGVPVRITLGRPRFRLPYEYEEIRLLAPTPAIFRLRDDAEFEAAYLDHLNRVGVERLRGSFDALIDKHGGSRLVLLCYEDVLAGQLCHRRMFAKWWFEHTGERVPELGSDSGGIADTYQRRLF